MTMHTEGPWVARKHGVISGGPYFHGKNGPFQKQVAMACVMSESENAADERDANARLIAAAPDMAAALKAFIKYNEGDWDQGPEHDDAYQNCINLARAAIKTGEPL